MAIIATAVFTQCSKESSPAPAPAAPVADYAYTGANGPAPCTVQFLNASTNATSYAWDFGDNGISSDANPSHTFLNSGVYTVKLTAKGAGGSNQTTQTINIGAAFTKVSATSVKLSLFPFTDGTGAGWDNGSGPDVYIKILQYNGPGVASTVLYDGSSKVVNDVAQSALPLTYTLATPLSLSSSTYIMVDIWDYDPIGGDDHIGTTPYLNIDDSRTLAQPYPTSIRANADITLDALINLKWQ